MDKMNNATIDKITRLLIEREWEKFFGSSFYIPFDLPAVYIHRYYQQKDSEIPKGYRWRMHNRACGMTPDSVKPQGQVIWVKHPPRIQKTPHLVYLKDKETVKL